MIHDVYAYGFTMYQNKHVQSSFPIEPICDIQMAAARGARI